MDCVFLMIFYYLLKDGWRYVGELSELLCYPVKSCAPVYPEEMECTVLGLQKGFLRDRVLMVITDQGNFVTARMYPKLLLIRPEINGQILHLSAPDMENMKLDIEKLPLEKSTKASIWSTDVDIVDCGDDFASWVSRYILQEPNGLRIVYYPLKHSQRKVQDSYRCYEEMKPIDGGALQDDTSFNILNASSLDDLNSRLDMEPIIALQFRPNFVVKGPLLPYEEDHWKWVKIGEVVFRVLKPGDRCVFTTINPITAEKHKGNEPIATLRKYRLIPQAGQSPIFGTSLGLRVPGNVKLGDQVYVNA